MGWFAKFSKLLIVHLFWPKNRFCANFNQTGPVGFGFSLALGPHENDNNIDLHTDRQTFSNHILGSGGKVNMFSKGCQISTQTKWHFFKSMTQANP